MQQTDPNEQPTPEIVYDDSNSPTEEIDAAREHIDTLIETAYANMNMMPTEEQRLMMKEIINQYLDEAKLAGYKDLTSDALSIYVMSGIYKIKALTESEA